MLNYFTYAQQSPYNDSLLSQKATGAFAIAFNNADSAMKIANGVLTEAKRKKNKSIIANAYNSIGWAYMHQGHLDSSILFLEKSRNIFLSLQNNLEVIRVDLNLTEVYTKQNTLARAIARLIEADSLSALIKNKTLQTDIKRLFGIVYREAGDYKKALPYFQLAVRGFEEQQDYFHYVNTVTSLSILYRTMNLPDSSISLLNKGIKIAHANNATPYQVAMLEENLAETYFTTGTYSEALPHYLSAYTIFKKLNNGADIAFEEFCIGKTYAKLKQYKEAETYLAQAYRASDSLNLSNYTLDIANALSEMYRQSGNWQRAYKYLTLSTTLKDSLDLGMQIKETNELKERYEAEKKEVQIQMLQTKNEQIIWWFISGILAALLIGTLFWQRRYRRKINEERILNYFATSLYNQNTIEDVFWDIAKNCISKLNFEDCVIYSFNNHQKVLVQKAAFGPKNPDGYIITNHLEIPLGKGIVGAVAASHKPEIISDTTKDVRYIVDDERRFSEITVPILLEGKLLGIIDSEHHKKNFFKKRHLKLLQKIADTCTKKITRHFVEDSLRKQIASDLHDDIGSTLSSINILSNIAIQKKVPEEYLNRQMVRINEHSKKMMESMDDMVWAINPLNDNMESLAAKMKEWASEFCEISGIQLSFTIPENIVSQPLDVEKRKNIFLIFKEAVNNAIKYSVCSSLKVSFSKEGNLLAMEVQDDGKGFDTAIKQSGNGLRNMRERAIAINGNIVIESASSKGTSIKLFFMT